MGKKTFNFDLYVDDLLTEALSLTQMQEQLRGANLDPAKYDQKHLLFLVGLINSNQDLEIYNDLLSKIKDKGLLSSLLSVSVNDRRSDKPTIDLDKVTRALQHAEDPNELRSILSGQKRQEQVTQSTYDKKALQWYLATRSGIELLDILAKLEVKLDGELDRFIAEYSRKAEEVKEYLLTNAQRAKNIQDLIAILHEGETKNINPFNSTTSLTLKDLQDGALYYNNETHIYIIRTTFRDDLVKSIRWNLKYGQGNRFGLCISSRSENYYAGYRTGNMGGYPLTTYFVYSLYDKSADPSDINNYEIAIVDAQTRNGSFSYNPVATVATRSKKDIHGHDGVTWTFSNEDIGELGPYTTLTRLDHIFKNKKELLGKDGSSYTLDEYNFKEIFEYIPLGPKEQKIQKLIRNFEPDDFLDFSDSEKMALVTDGELRSAVLHRGVFEKLSPEVRMSIVKLTDRYIMNDPDAAGNSVYNKFTDAEKRIYAKTAIKDIKEELNKQLKLFAYKHRGGKEPDITDPEIVSMIVHQFGGPTLSLLDFSLIANDEQLKTIYVDGLQANNKKIRDYVLSKVDENGVYKGSLDLTSGAGIFTYENFFTPKYFLPDLSDIIINGSFSVYYMNLLSLKGCPKVVENLYASGNMLPNLEGGPIAAIKYDVSGSSLTSLRGAPKYVYEFNISNNMLTSLEGCPEYVGGDFIMHENLFRSLEGMPKIIGGNFTMYRIPEKLILDFDPSSIIVGGNYFINGDSYKHLLKAPQLYKVDELRDEFLWDKKQEVTKQVMSDFKTKKQAGINKESAVYSLLKSYLLRS